MAVIPPRQQWMPTGQSTQIPTGFGWNLLPEDIKWHKLKSSEFVADAKRGEHRVYFLCKEGADGIINEVVLLTKVQADAILDADKNR